MPHDEDKDRCRVMKHSDKHIRAAANDMLGQLHPRSMLRDARELALKIQRDEVFSGYFTTRIWAVLPVVLVFVLVSSVCSIDIMLRVVRLASDPPLLLRGFALLLAAAMWLCGVVAQIYVFLIWLEGRAAQKDRSERGIQHEVPAGVLAYLKYSRALPPWIVIAICVVAPLAIMARNAPLAALLLLAVSMLAPFLFKKFDS